MTTTEFRIWVAVIATQWVKTRLNASSCPRLFSGLKEKSKGPCPKPPGSACDCGNGGDVVCGSDREQYSACEARCKCKLNIKRPLSDPIILYVKLVCVWEFTAITIEHKGPCGQVRLALYVILMVTVGQSHVQPDRNSDDNNVCSFAFLVSGF